MPWSTYYSQGYAGLIYQTLPGNYIILIDMHVGQFHIWKSILKDINYEEIVTTSILPDMGTNTQLNFCDASLFGRGGGFDRN